jgi:predicted GTPase
MVKPMRVLICGIPNVGKSTLINTLMRRKAAKTGDEAGITTPSSASRWPTTSTCSTRPACCGRASWCPKAA